MSLSIDYALANSEQIVRDLGARLERIRLSRNLTQAELADEAGVSKRTIMRLERGVGPTLDTFIRVLLALGMSSNLAALLPDADVRPMERVLNRGRERQRARRATPKAKPATPFRWGDEATKR